MDSEDISRFDETGALHLPGAAAPVLDRLREALAQWPDGHSGTRITGDPELRAVFDESGPIGSLVVQLMRKSVFPVRAIHFDKNDTNNWALGWHQDRTIAVAARTDAPGFGPWTRKRGIVHVQPPFAVIAAMRTIRIHFDPVPQDNAPLLVATGSHKLGLIAAARARSVAESTPILTCLAEPGDVWAYHTAVLHASHRSAPCQRRRVLQVDYASEPLTADLKWLGI